MEQNINKKKRIFLILAILVLIPIIWFFFLNKKGGDVAVSEKLTGKWLRSDGVYTLEIKSVNENGMLDVTYFNPNPVELGRTEWIIQKNVLHVLIELQGPYEKSNYQLVYDEKKKTLYGTFYQAVAQETYKVDFNKVK